MMMVLIYLRIMIEGGEMPENNKGNKSQPIANNNNKKKDKKE